MDRKDDSSDKMAFKPIVTKKASEVIYDTIRERILSREIKHGERLPSEKELMDMFKRSRPTIREALRMLEREGLIRTIQGSSGAVVCHLYEMPLHQMFENYICINRLNKKELMDFRQVNELAMARWASEHREESDLYSLKMILEQMEVAEDKSVSEFIAFDILFHKALASACKNRLSGAFENTFFDRTADSFEKSMKERQEEDVKAILRVFVETARELYLAVLNRDALLAVRAMERHLFFARDIFKNQTADEAE